MPETRTLTLTAFGADTSSVYYYAGPFDFDFGHPDNRTFYGFSIYPTGDVYARPQIIAGGQSLQDNGIITGQVIGFKNGKFGSDSGFPYVRSGYYVDLSEPATKINDNELRNLGFKITEVGSPARAGTRNLGGFDFEVSTVSVTIETPDYWFGPGGLYPGDSFWLVMDCIIARNEKRDAFDNRPSYQGHHRRFAELVFPGSSSGAALTHSNANFERATPDPFSAEIVGRRLKLRVEVPDGTDQATRNLVWSTIPVVNGDAPSEILYLPLGSDRAAYFNRFTVTEEKAELLLYVSRSPNAIDDNDVLYTQGKYPELLEMMRTYTPQFPPISARLPICRLPMERKEGKWSAQTWLDLPDVACNFQITAQILSDQGRSTTVYRQFENGGADGRFWVAVAGVPITVSQNEKQEVGLIASVPTLMQPVSVFSSASGTAGSEKIYEKVWRDALPQSDSPEPKKLDQFSGPVGSETSYYADEIVQRGWGLGAAPTALQTVANTRLTMIVPRSPEQTSSVYSGDLQATAIFQSSPTSYTPPPSKLRFDATVTDAIHLGYFALSCLSGHEFGASQLVASDASSGAWSSDDHGKAWKAVEDWTPAWERDGPFKPLHLAYIGHNEGAWGSLALRVPPWPSGEMASDDYPPDPTLHFRRTFDGGKTWDEIVEVGMLAPRTPLWGAALWVRNLDKAPRLFIAQGDTLRWCSDDLGATWEIYDSVYEAPAVPGSEVTESPTA